MLTTTKQEGIEFARWQAEGAPLAVEIRRDVLEEIRRRAEDGFQKVGHGGIEHGGILYGTAEGDTVRVLEWRPLPCEHARGPSFTLSDNDRAALDQLLASPEPALAALKPLGWWVSHSRSKLTLKPHDADLHNRFFPFPHQFVLVLKPMKDAATAAGLFHRLADGALPAGEPLEPFTLTPSASALMAPPRPTAAKSASPQAAAPEPRPIPAPRPQAAAPPPPAPAEIPAPSFLQPPPPSAPGRWRSALWIAASAALLAAAAYFLPGYFEGRSASASLRVEEQHDELFIRWEGTSPALRRADRGALEIHDGGPLQVIPLDRDEIQGGAVTYVRRSTDVQVRLTAYRGGKAVVQEFTRYLGPPVSAPRASAPAGAELEQLNAESRRLATALQQEAARNARLRESVQILETRLRQEDANRPRVNP